jgi:hypothetical protein
MLPARFSSVGRYRHAVGFSIQVKFIETTDVIQVRVSEQNRVEQADLEVPNLVPEIGRAIHKDAFAIFCLYQ